MLFNLRDKFIQKITDTFALIYTSSSFNYIPKPILDELREPHSLKFLVTRRKIVLQSDNDQFNDLFIYIISILQSWMKNIHYI